MINVDLFNDIFDFNRGLYNFNRVEKDMKPYNFISVDENTIILTHNVLGIDKKDLKVSIENKNNKQTLTIKGRTEDKITKQVYDVNSQFDIKRQDIENIECKAENGLLYVTIKFKVNNAETGYDITVK